MIDAALASGVIAVVRLPAAADFRALAGALVAGGVSVVEITLTTPGALAAIADLTAPNAVPGAVVGAGTVLDERSARAVIAAGARFVVSPTLDQAVVRCCRDANVPCVPGALTPRELVEAARAGASHIKLFPASGLATSARCSPRCRFSAWCRPVACRSTTRATGSAPARSRSASAAPW